VATGNVSWACVRRFAVPDTGQFGCPHRTVLMVIAIGVGIVATTTSQTVYEPSWSRF
jgi:hypothetical protein